MSSFNGLTDATYFMDHNHPDVAALAERFRDIGSEKERATEICEYVRNRFRYDPYHLDLRKRSLRASAILSKRKAWCVEKAIVCAALMRASGIPAKLGFGIVKNHIGVEKLTSYLKREEIVFHGFVRAQVDGLWSSCTPAFDDLTCRVSGVAPLRWNAAEDSLFQAYKGESRFMEYLHYYGEFEDVPLALMVSEMQKHYPHLFDEMIVTPAFSFRFD
jgi:hypothetical protein